MIAALLQTDERTGRRWLSFPRPPAPPLRQSLLDAGWRYHGGHRAWHHDDPVAPIPTGFHIGRGGACNYSVVRPVQGAEILDLLARTRAQIALHGGAPA
jgi:hypothetical protein